MTKPSWDERIQRAEQLATDYPFASEVLRFYKHIACFQKDLHAYLASVCGRQVEKKGNGSLRDELDLIVLLPKFPYFLSLVHQVGTPALKQLAGDLAGQGHDRWLGLLTAYWTATGQTGSLEENPAIFFARAFLQPYAEYLADYTEDPAVAGPPRVCPLCQGKPQVGVLRPEGDGAKRSLICSLCSFEWDYRRLICPACEEEGTDKLSIYTAAEFQHVRIEACDSCKMYMETVDLTRNGLAVPVVDELAALPLSLWAAEKGYVKLQPNLMGL